MKHEIAELLPFYANGTLDAADRARVEAELATCAACSEELHEIATLGHALSAHAGEAPALPARVFDDALARITTSPVVAATTRLHGAWWSTPARYATAAALVLGFGAAGVAAWHAHETQLEESTGTMVYRVSPGPTAAKLKVANANGTAVSRVAAEAVPAAAPAVREHHRLAKKARIELLVRDVEASLQQAQRVVRGAGGQVTALADATPTSADAVHSATLDVEVPADRLDDTLDRLAQLGAVRNRAIDAEDVDATIVDEEARLRNLRRAEVDLLRLMDRGGKVSEILTVQQNLSDVRGQIEQLTAQHEHDVHRVATSTIAIALTEDRPNVVPAKPGPTARIDGAWRSGVNALADTLVAFVSTVAWCVAYAPVPLALAAAAYGATRLVMRRRATAG